MADKVYVITRGEYSDYHICGVTLDLKTALLLKKLHSNSWESAVIEEYNLATDQDFSGEWLPVYQIQIDQYGGCSCCFDRWVLDRDPFVPEFNLQGQYTWKPFMFTAELTAKDEAHALKIAQDKRAEMLNDYFIEHGGSFSPPYPAQAFPLFTITTSPVIMSAEKEEAADD